MTIVLLFGIPGAAAAALLLVLSSIRVLAAHERAVQFRLGRVVGTKGPGLFFVRPVVDQLVKVDVRTAISRDRHVTHLDVRVRLGDG